MNGPSSSRRPLVNFRMIRAEKLAIDKGKKVGQLERERQEDANESSRRSGWNMEGKSELYPIRYRPIRDASQHCQVHCQGWADRDACVSALRPPSRGLLGVA